MSAVVRRTLEVVNERGLHARAATKLVHLASRFDAEVTLEKDGQRANAKSVMGVLLLCGSMGTQVDVTELATYGWVCFAEHACLDWLARPNVTEDQMVALLVGALQGPLAAAGVTEMNDA